jgi:hypothetical protein
LRGGHGYTPRRHRSIDSRISVRINAGHSSLGRFNQTMSVMANTNTSSPNSRSNGKRRYESLLPDYEISADVWERAIRLADRVRASGVTVPLADLLIFACAKIHGLEVAHDDAHFDDLTRLEA